MAFTKCLRFDRLAIITFNQYFRSDFSRLHVNWIGLDEVTAAQCIRLLRNLAKQNRTVVCTIHQPSATTFALFDHIFVLARGQCVFQGGPSVLVPFLNKLTLRCPTHYNPSDYIIELCDSDYDGTIVPALARETHNGKLVCTIDSNEMVDSQSSDIVKKSAITSMFLEKPKSRGGALLEKMKAFTKFMQNDHAVSKLRQFSVLFAIMMLKIWRNKSVLLIQLFHHVFCGIIFGKQLEPIFIMSEYSRAKLEWKKIQFCVETVAFLNWFDLISLGFFIAAFTCRFNLFQSRKRWLTNVRPLEILHWNYLFLSLYANYRPNFGM